MPNYAHRFQVVCVTGLLSDSNVEPVRESRKYATNCVEEYIADFQAAILFFYKCTSYSVMMQAPYVAIGSGVEVHRYVVKLMIIITTTLVLLTLALTS